MSVRLVCGNCGKIETWESWEAAEAAGWDTVATFGYNACEECPGASVYFPMYYASQARSSEDPEIKAKYLEMAAAETMKRHPRFPPSESFRGRIA